MIWSPPHHRAARRVRRNTTALVTRPHHRAGTTASASSKARAASPAACPACGGPDAPQHALDVRRRQRCRQLHGAEVVEDVLRRGRTDDGDDAEPQCEGQQRRSGVAPRFAASADSAEDRRRAGAFVVTSPGAWSTTPCRSAKARSSPLNARSARNPRLVQATGRPVQAQVAVLRPPFAAAEREVAHGFVRQ